MTDFSDARVAKCHRCGAVFCPEDGGCNCNDYSETDEESEELTQEEEKENDYDSKN